MHQTIYPLLMGGCQKYRAKRSVIVDAANSASISWAPGAAGNLKQWTASIVCKLVNPVSYMPLFDADNTGNDTITFGAINGGQLRWITNAQGSATSLLQTTSLFTDTSGWLHFLFNLNTPHATAAERQRMFTQGQRISQFASVSYIAQNADLRWNNTGLHQLGKERTNYGSFIFGDFKFIDGQGALDPTDFGRFDPKSGTFALRHFMGGYGLNGRHYPFVGDAGDAPATAAEGMKDRAPIDGTHVAANNATAAGIATTDFVKDSPTNFKIGTDLRGNFCTWSPNNPGGKAGYTGQTVSDGGLRVSPTTSHTAFGTIALPRTGWYFWSSLYESGSWPIFGIAQAQAAGNTQYNTGPYGWQYVWYGNGGNGTMLPGSAGADANSPNTVGDEALVCVRVQQNKVWLGRRRAGVVSWIGGGDPIAGTNPTFSGSGGGGVYRTDLDLSVSTWYPFVAGSAGGPTWRTNFGQRTAAYWPAGYLPLCVPALPKATIVRPAAAFVQAVDTGANISSALATKRAAWGNSYIDIIRSTGAEGWRFRFGDDPTKFLDSSDNANPKQNFPALAGGSYWGGSIRTGATYGVVSGEAVHVNGVTTTITDNLGTGRKIVIVRRADAGGAWYTYHPDLTAGKLIYLNTSAGETTDGSIGAFTSNSFQIHSGQPSGTYRYIVLAETSGLIGIGFYWGHGSVPGPMCQLNHSSALTFWKRTDSAGDSYVVPSALNSNNPRDYCMSFNSASAAGPAPSRAVEVTANGIQQRGSPAQADANANGGVYVVLSFAEFAFATGDCAAQGMAR
ncbi:hypothetical protein [Ferrovibrio terrae]|uniref:DUF7483 domain-containing protein n=1 Tax=Ferrovibrio terrae TaxID=2594003 RepID=UPI003137B2DF